MRRASNVSKHILDEYFSLSLTGPDSLGLKRLQGDSLHVLKRKISSSTDLN